MLMEQVVSMSRNPQDFVVYCITPHLVSLLSPALDGEKLNASCSY